MANQSLIDIVNLNYSDLLQIAVDLKDDRVALQEWDINNMNDPLRLILDAYLKAIVQLGKFSNNIGQEFSMATALTRTSVKNKAYFSGYSITDRTGATGVLQITLDGGLAVDIDQIGRAHV